MEGISTDKNSHLWTFDTFFPKNKVKVWIRKMAENTDETIEMLPLVPENQPSNVQTISTSASKSIANPNPTDEEENTDTSCFSRFWCSITSYKIFFKILFLLFLRCKPPNFRLPQRQLRLLRNPKIILDWTTNFILPGVDEITDLISGVRYFM